MALQKYLVAACKGYHLKLRQNLKKQIFCFYETRPYLEYISWIGLQCSCIGKYKDIFGGERKGVGGEQQQPQQGQQAYVLP